MLTKGIFSRHFVFNSIVMVAIAALLPILQGCFASYWTHSDNDVAVGEERTVDFPEEETFVMTQDVLRGHGVLFDVKPGHQILTLWKPADTSEGVFSNLIGNVAQYRYEIEIVADGSRRSKIVANVRTENIPTDEIGNYQPSKKLNLFNDFDQLAAKLPPPPLTPGSGGVNFAVLPGEDLAALSKRVTGNPDNWPQIAKDNGLKSASDTAGLQSVWIANSLLPKPKAVPSHPASGLEHGK